MPLQNPAAVAPSVPVRLQIETSTSQSRDRQEVGGVRGEEAAWGINGGIVAGARADVFWPERASLWATDWSIDGWRADGRRTAQKLGKEGARGMSGDATDWPGRKCSLANGGKGDAMRHSLFCLRCAVVSSRDWNTFQFGKTELVITDIISPIDLNYNVHTIKIKSAIYSTLSGYCITTSSTYVNARPPFSPKKHTLAYIQNARSQFIIWYKSPQ